MFAFDQAALLQRGNVFRDRRFRTDSEVAGDLRVRGFVTMLREKASNVIEDFFLALSSRQHVIVSVASDGW